MMSRGHPHSSHQRANASSGIDFKECKIAESIISTQVHGRDAKALDRERIYSQSLGHPLWQVQF